MITAEMVTQATEILGHPLGKRKTDDKLAMAAVKGNLGLRQTLPGAYESLSQGVAAIGRQGSAMAALVARIRQKRTWYLPRAQQVDQNGYPACVAATGEEWEHCEPLRTSRTLGFMEIYRRCKLVDGDTQDGTWASSMLRVYAELQKVRTSWWWKGTEDNAAIDDWLLNIGPLWWGAYWQESAFRTVAQSPRDGSTIRGKHFMECVGEKRWGHEVLIIGTDRTRRTRTIVNHWGLEHWGIEGRAEILDEDFADHLEHGGADLFGVVEQRAA